MNVTEFDNWSAGLPADRRARALAALGVLTAAGIDPLQAPDALALELADVLAAPADPVPWQRPIQATGSAAELDAAWSRVGEPQRPRLEVIADDAEAIWTLTQLSRRAVGARSVFLRRDEPTTNVGWRWPLRIALVGASEASMASLRELAAEHRWFGRLVRLSAPGPDCDVVDLLLLPMDLPAAVAAVVQRQPPYRADCTLVLGRGAGVTQRTVAYVGAIRAAVHTAGVGIVAAPADLAGWLLALVEQIAHDQPLDVALFATASTGPPLLVASRRLADESRLSTRVRAVGTALAEAPASAAAPPLPSDSILARQFGSTDVRAAARAMAGAREEDFRNETDMASVAAEVIAADERRMAAAPGLPPEPRFIQAQVTDARTGAAAAAWRRGQLHEISVRIGPADAEWLGPGSDGTFPDHELPPERDEHDLRIVFAEPRLLAEPATQFVTLPRRGASTTARFLLPVGEQTAQVQARIVVTYENRVLQTALLEGAVDAAPTLRLEAIVRPAPAGLEERRRFDAALVLNNDGSGTPGVMTLASAHVAFRAVPDLEREIEWFDRQLTQVARNRKEHAGGLAADANVTLLRSLALHGSMLYQHLVTDTLADDPLARGERLQIVSTKPEARLPVEFVYDRTAPDDDATLCPQAEPALASGACADSCPRGPAHRRVVCPLGFWGLSRVLERHAHDARTSRSLGAQDFAFQAEPVSARRTLAPLAAAQVAVTQRVTATVPGGLDRVRDAAGAATQAPATTAESWDGWVSSLAAGGRSLLVLIVHTDHVSDSDTMPRMEIGHDSWLVSARVGAQHVRPTLDAPPPVVLLVGCETGAPDISFFGLAAQLRRHGAAIVVSTGARIHSEQAVPMTASLIEEMAAVANHQAGCFGEAMRAMRRRLVAQGQLMALTLTAFGDADWRLAR